MSLRVKICCIRSVDEALMAADNGAAAVGLVSAMPTGPGVIPDDRIAEIAAALPAGVASFLLTSRQSVDGIAAQHAVCRTTTVQIVDRLERGSHAELRDALPGVEIVQVIHVMDTTAIDEAVELDSAVDALLLDSGNPTLAAKELGGTGRTHDWSVSARLCESVDAPVLLAGGLNADNVVAAVEKVRPAGVDVCSGVRTDDRLDPAKLQAMLGKLRAAGLLA